MPSGVEPDVSFSLHPIHRKYGWGWMVSTTAPLLGRSLSTRVCCWCACRGCEAVRGHYIICDIGKSRAEVVVASLGELNPYSRGNYVAESPEAKGAAKCEN
jgi:hypothetical protein